MPAQTHPAGGRGVGLLGTGACCREGDALEGQPLPAGTADPPCLPRVAQPNPPPASHKHHGASQLGQGCTGQPDAGPASPSPGSGMCRTGPSPSPCPPPALSQRDPHCCRGSSAEDARGVPALQPGLGVLSVLLTVPRLGSNSNPTRPPGLTFRPIHLFMGFMRNEERKPLMYITRGMVAIYFCKR